MIFLKEFFEKDGLEKRNSKQQKSIGKELIQEIPKHGKTNSFKPSTLFMGLWQTLPNSAETDQMPQNTASDQVWHDLLTECKDKLRTSTGRIHFGNSTT